MKFSVTDIQDVERLKISTKDLNDLQKSYVSKFFQDAQYFEASKRGCQVDMRDPIVLQNALDAVHREGPYMRHCAVLQWKALHPDDKTEICKS